MTDHKRFWRRERAVYRILIVVCAIVLVAAIAAVYFMAAPVKEINDTENGYSSIPEEDPDRIENGIHLRTGFAEGVGLMETVNNCTGCHSAQLVTQNRMSREGWVATIRWMQESQNLWDLGEEEPIIVNYLATHYTPTDKGRRENLANIDWYVLEE
ncbi:MAG TPA: hypothetical protein VKN36_13945 [Eudoraea sp.]|nr:hypothetical protein [Eudoraea sp.]